MQVGAQSGIIFIPRTGREAMADPRREFLRRTRRSREIHEREKTLIPMAVVGTVDMPYPVYIVEGEGSRIVDVDGNEYIDLSMGFGCHVLGHAHPVVVEAVRDAATRGVQFGIHTPYQEPLARLLVDASPCAEAVLFCNSGTEATMYAMRAARAHSGRTRIALFEGAYHGAHDAVLVKTDESSARNLPRAVAKGAGLPQEFVDQVLMLPYRHEAALELIRRHAGELALVMVEPVQGSNPTLECRDFLAQLIETCRDAGVLVMFDEVITGFRLAYGGAQEEMGLTPDLAAYGKTLGGGMPVGAVAGRVDLLSRFDWHRETETGGRVFAGGTFGGNPVTMSAGAATLRHLNSHPEIYADLREQGRRLRDEVGAYCEEHGFPARVMSAHSMIHLRFQPGPILTSRDVDRHFAAAEKEFYTRVMLNGVLIPGDHLALTSAAHSSEDIDAVVAACLSALADTPGLAPRSSVGRAAREALSAG